MNGKVQFHRKTHITNKKLDKVLLRGVSISIYMPNENEEKKPQKHLGLGEA